MSKPPKYWHKAKISLSKRDPILKKIIKQYNKGHLTNRSNPFFSLCRTIVGQQISIKAADTIWNRLEAKCKKKIIPQNIIKLKATSMKKAGLSRQKISYLKNIAKSFKNKSFDVSSLRQMNDLNRPDIFPTKDIGLIRAISKNYKKNYPPSEKFLNKISNLHSGYRTVFTWYMWRSIDPTDVEY